MSSNNNDIIKYAASNDASFRFSGPVEIVGLGAANEKVRNAGLQITLTPLVDSVKALDKSALKSVGAAILGGVAGGGVGALAAFGMAIAHETLKSTNEQKNNQPQNENILHASLAYENVKPGEEPKGNDVQGKKAPTVGFRFI